MRGSMACRRSSCRWLASFMGHLHDSLQSGAPAYSFCRAFFVFSKRHKICQPTRKSGSEREAMSKHKHTVKPGLHVKQRSGHRAFTYQVPPEVADHLPPGINVVLRSFTRDELLALARQAEPQVLRRLMAQPAKNALEALLLMFEEIYGFLQGKGLPIPHTQQIELAQLLAHTYDFSARLPYSRAQTRAAILPAHPPPRP